jgi:hypothetical protein
LNLLLPKVEPAPVPRKVSSILNPSHVVPFGYVGDVA